MILTDNQIKEIVNEYAKENNLDIEKYSLYNAINWYNWWRPQTRWWHKPALEYTYEESKETIISWIRSTMIEYKWEEKYGYKGNYDDGRKICKQCKYSKGSYMDKFSTECITMFCTKLSDKYNMPIEVTEHGNICNKFESMYKQDINLDLEEYFDWLAKAWYVNFKGETTLGNNSSLVIINKIYFGIPYLKYFKEQNIIENDIINSKSYHGGKWNVRSKKYKIQGCNIRIDDLLKIEI